MTDTIPQQIDNQRIGEILLEAGIIRPDDLPLGLSEAAKYSVDLGDVLVMMHFMSPDDLKLVLAAQTMLSAGEINDRTAVLALRLASQKQIPFERAVENVLLAQAESPEALRRQLSETHEELAQVEKQQGRICKDAAFLQVKIAQINAQLDNFKEAEAAYNTALSTYESCYGAKHLKIAACLGMLTDLYLQFDQLDLAEKTSWKGFELVQELVGGDKIESAQHAERMALVLERQRKYTESEQYYLSALRVKEKILGPDHPDIIAQLKKMSAIWRRQGKRSEKKRIGDLLLEAGLLEQSDLQQALQAANQQGIPLGQYLLTSKTINEQTVRAAIQAQLLINDGVLPAQLAVKALRLCCKLNLRLDVALAEIGWEPELMQTRDLTEMITVADELITAELTLGPNHCGVALVCQRMGDCYTDHGRYSEAELQYKRALSILEKFFGPDDLEVANGLYKLGCVYQRQNKHIEAEPLHWRSLTIRQKNLGSNDEDIAWSLHALAECKLYQKEQDVAEMYLKSGIGVLESRFGKENLKLCRILDTLAECYFINGKFDEAEITYLRLSRLKQRDEAKTLEVADILERLAHLYATRNNFFKAETQLELALELRERELGTNHSDVASALERFAAIMKNAGKDSQAAELADRAKGIRKSLLEAQD